MNYDLESIVIKIDTDASGNLKIPVAWYTTSWDYWWTYDWQVSYDDWEFVRYQWTWSGSAITIASWLWAWTNHTVVIKPTTEAYGWARAFWFDWSWVADLLTEIVWDKTYMWYAISATNTWDYFRFAQYYFCNRITSIPEEYMPDTVTTIWNYFRYCQYQSCTSLLTLTPEVLSNQVITIWTYFRSCQYCWESDITMSIMNAADEAMPDTVITIGNSFRASMYWNCTLITTPAEEVMPDSITAIWSYFRKSIYRWCTSLLYPTEEVFSKNVTTIWDDFRMQQYSWCSNLLIAAKEVFNNKVITIWNQFRRWQYYNCSLIEKSFNEVFSDSVTTIWNYFRYLQFYNCSSLLECWNESFSNNIITIWDYFRYQQYRWCPALINPAEEVLPNSITTIWEWFRAYQYYWCEALIKPAKEVLSNNITTIASHFREREYYNCKSMKTPAVEYLPDSVITIWDQFRRCMYAYSWVTKTAVEYVPPHLTTVWWFYRDQQYLFCESLTEIVKEADLPWIPVWNWFRVSQYRSCPSITKAKLAAFTWTFLGNNRNLMFTDSLSTITPITITIIWHAFEKPQASLWITNDAVVDKIYVDSNFLQQYKSSSNWSAISDDKFVWISTASVTAWILVWYKKNFTNVDKQLILAGSTLELCPRRVLTWTENWVRDAANNRVYMTITQDTTSWYWASSTHWPCKQSSSDTTRDDWRCTDNKKLCCYTTKNSLQEFKDWLAQEYADWTPVIVINYNGAFNTRPWTPQDINVMDWENIIEVMSTAAPKPEDIKLEATVALDVWRYSSYIFKGWDVNDINNWLEISKAVDISWLATKEEVEEWLEEKQDIIEDLDIIRDWAQAWVEAGWRITAIESKIPNQATQSNQLADKDFVNSSVSTNTAKFFGNFDTYALFQAAWWTTETNNDYAVVSDDETHNHQMSRYKFNWTAWSYEYKVNDTPMTAAQLSALNSWISSSKVSQYDWYNTTKREVISAASKVYATSSTWAQTQVSYGSSIVADGIVQRAGQQITVPETPTADWHATSKKYVDGLVSTAWQVNDVKVDWTSVVTNKVANIDLSWKVDKTTDWNRIYGTDSRWFQKTFEVWSSAVDGAITVRTTNWNIKVPETPTLDFHAASKKYVDDWLNTKQPKLESGTNVKTINNISILWSWNIEISTIIKSNTQPTNHNDWDVWYNTYDSTYYAYIDWMWWYALSYADTADYSYVNQPATIAWDTKYISHNIWMESDWTTITSISTTWAVMRWRTYVFYVKNTSDTNDMYIAIEWIPFVIQKDKSEAISIYYDTIDWTYKAISGTDNYMTQEQYDKLAAQYSSSMWEDWVTRYIYEVEVEE